MAILCGPPHHPSCPARYDALGGCTCLSVSGSGEEVATAPAASAGLSAHGAAVGAVPQFDEHLLEAEQASVERYMSVRQHRVDAIRLARSGAA